MKYTYKGLPVKVVPASGSCDGRFAILCGDVIVCPRWLPAWTWNAAKTFAIEEEAIDYIKANCTAPPTYDELCAKEVEGW